MRVYGSICFENSEEYTFLTLEAATSWLQRVTGCKEPLTEDGSLVNLEGNRVGHIITEDVYPDQDIWIVTNWKGIKTAFLSRATAESYMAKEIGPRNLEAIKIKE